MTEYILCASSLLSTSLFTLVTTWWDRCFHLPSKAGDLPPVPPAPPLTLPHPALCLCPLIGLLLESPEKRWGSPEVAVSLDQRHPSLAKAALFLWLSPSVLAPVPAICLATCLATCPFRTRDVFTSPRWSRVPTFLPSLPPHTMGASFKISCALFINIPLFPVTLLYKNSCPPGLLALLIEIIH